MYNRSVQEKRKFPRKAVDLPASFTGPSGERVAAVCVDVSLGGAYVATEAPASFGASIELTLRLAAADREIEIPCIVRWTKADGMGVQFGLMGARETHLIVSFLAT